MNRGVVVKRGRTNNMAVGEAKRRTRRGGAAVDSFYATNHEYNVIQNNAPKKSADAFFKSNNQHKMLLLSLSMLALLLP